MSENSEARSQQVLLYPEQELRAALDRLDADFVDGQEAWVLGKLYELTLEIGTSGGQVTMPAGAVPSTAELKKFESRTLTHLLREQPACDEARKALENLDLQGSPADIRSQIRSIVPRAADAYRTALHEARRVHGENRDHVIFSAGGTVLPFEETMNWWDHRLTAVREAIVHLSLLDRLAETKASLLDEIQQALKDVKEASTDLETQRTSLKDLRAQEASRNLSTHFETLARNERWKGAALRVLSVAALLAAMGIAWTAGVSKESLGSWTELSRHLALTLLLAGGAAYGAKLASSHYTFGQWARSIQVQLDSFEGFIGVVEEQSARDRMREEFGRRVLGAPPQATDDGSTGLTAGELLQVLASARASSSPASKGS
ncbi:hypothetical protein ACIRON_13410 [Nocardioides sp. NPDC101246]|uniref:hypothetical protein n=1 Tax=Nocardioides sp. NPDC101246 TaxID=3364336 RepID=UPI00381F408C